MDKKHLQKIIREEIVKELGEPFYSKEKPITAGDLYKWLSDKPSEMPIEIWVGRKFVDFKLDDVILNNTRNKIMINLD